MTKSLNTRKVLGLFVACNVAGTALAALLFGFTPVAMLVGSFAGNAFAGYMLASLGTPDQG
jgi:hypothetical protein